MPRGERVARCEGEILVERGRVDADQTADADGW